MTSSTLPRRRHCSDGIEILEARIAPATLVSLDAITHRLLVQGDYVDDGSSTVQPGAPESLSFTIAQTNLVITDSLHGVTAVGSGVSQAGLSQVTIPLASLTGDIAIDTGTGTDSLSFSNTLTLAANKNLSAQTTGTINFATNAQLSSSGTGKLTLTTDRDIFFAAGSSLNVVNGDVTLTAHGTVSGNYSGISLQGFIKSTGAGSILLTGTGGDTASGNNGIDINGQIMASGSGSVQLTGFGGQGTNDNTGIFASSGAIAAGNGGVVLTGTPGGDQGDSLGISLAIGVTSTGDIEIVTDKGLRFDNGAAVNAGSTAHIHPATAGTPITLDQFQQSSFALSDLMLTAVTAGQVIIGDGQSGTITVSGAIDSQNSLTLKTGAGVTGAADLGVAAGKNLSIESSGTIQLGGTVSVSGGVLSLTGVGADIGISLINAFNDFDTVHVVRGASVSLRDLNGFNFDAQATTLLSLQSAGAINQLAPITGGADLFKLGSGPLVLSFVNAIGNTTIAEGTIRFSNAGALGASTGTITLGNATTGSTDVSLLAFDNIAPGSFLHPIVVPSILGGGVVKIGSEELAASTVGVTYGGSLTLDRATTLQAGNAGGTFFKGPISGNVGTLTVDGAEKIGLGGSNNTFVGNVRIISSSILEILPGAPDVIPDLSNVNVEADSFFRLAKDVDETETIGNLTGDGTVSTGLASLLGPQELTITAAGAAFQFDGFIKNGAAPLSLIKKGSGTATLTGELSYSGATVVNAGTLALSNPDSSNPIDKSNLIVLRPGSTLDVLGLGGAGITQTLVLAPNQTLIGTGTIVGNLTGSGKVEPGDQILPGILTINGNFTPGGDVVFKLKGPYTTPGGNYDQIVIGAGGLLDLSAAKLRLLGGDTAVTAGTTVKLIANTGPGATTPGSSPVEGAFIGVGQAAFVLNYNAGNGSDVVLAGSPGQISLSAALASGKLTVADTASRPHRLGYSVVGANILINDPVEFFGTAPAGALLVDNAHTLSIPLTLVRAVQVNGGGSDDSLTVDFGTSTKKLPTGGFIFDGGLQASSVGDMLVLLGDNQGAVTYTYSGPGGGSVVLGNFGKIILAGLESVVNQGRATTQTFNLPTGLNHPALSDDDTAGNGLTRLSGATFPVTDFNSPVFRTGLSGVFVNPGSAADDLTLRLLPDFDDNLFLGSPFNRFDSISFVNSLDFTGDLEIDANTLTLPSDLHLSALTGELGIAGGSIDGTLSGGLGLVKTAAATPGTSLTLNGANTHTGETVVVGGPLILGNARAAQNSTVRIFSGQEVRFPEALGTFTVGGLAGPGALSLTNTGGGAATLEVGSNTSTYAGALSGPGTLHKVGAGTLTLTGVNTHSGTFLEGGILAIKSDLALGKAGIALKGDGGTLQAASTTTVARNIVLQSATTFQAAPEQTLTLSGVISGSGDLLIGDTGTVLVTGLANTSTGAIELGGGASQVVNGVTISTPGIKSGIVVTPGPLPGQVAKIDLTAVNVPVSLVIKNPVTGTVTVGQIVSTDLTAIKSISLGTNVKLGDGVLDSTPDLVVKGKLTTLTLNDVNANAIIELGKGLTYLNTYTNKPNVTLRNVGAGVVIDVTGNGMPAGQGGGGLGALTVNSWAGGGTVKTSQSITSFTVKTGDFNGSVQIDPGHLGAATVANIGKVSIPNGSWGGAGMQVEGIVTQFLTKGLIDGTTITAGAFGTISIKGNFGGSIISTYDANVTVPVKNKAPKVVATGVIGNVTIAGDFTGLINGDGKVGNVTLSGSARFQGTLRGASLGNITAASFTGTGATMGDPRHTITAIGSIGNITAKAGGLTDYLIAAGTDLGSDALVGGVADTYHSFFLTTTNVKTAVSIGAVNIKGVVQGTTIAAGIDPGLDGVYGDGNDLLIALPVDVTKTKVKIGALSFDANAISALTFSPSAPSTVTNAFEAQVLTSLKFGTGASAVTNPQFLKAFGDPTYFDSGGTSIVVRLLS